MSLLLGAQRKGAGGPLGSTTPRLVALLLALANALIVSQRGAHALCAYSQVKQATDLLPSGPGAASTSCKGCTLKLPRCNLVCKAGCLLPDGSRGPKASLPLGQCDPASHRIDVTTEGKLKCVASAYVAPPPPPPPASDFVTYSIKGVINKVMSHKDGPGAAREVVAWKLQEDNGPAMPRPLDFGGVVPDLVTGDSVIMDVSVPSSAVGDGGNRRRLSELNLPPGVPLSVAAFNRTAAGKALDFIVGGKPVSLAVGIFPFSMCGRKPSVTQQELLRARFFNGNSTRATTMEHMFSTCSFKKLLLAEGLSGVMPLEDLPCNGSRPDDAIPSRIIKYDFANNGTDNELYTMLYFAKQLATTKYSNLMTWSKLNRIVIVIPNLPKFGWSGLGTIGCNSGDQCTSWLQVDSSVSIPVTFQEMMHNTGLYHSERLQLDGTAVAYGEDPDPMGGGAVDSKVADGIVCTNAPQSWKAGWANSTEVNMTSMVLGTLSTYTLPSLAISGGVGAMLRVVMYDDGLAKDNKPNYQRALFVSYRARMPAPAFDSGLPAVWDKRVYLHQYDGVAVPRAEADTTPPYLLGMLDARDAVVTEPPPGAPVPVRSSWVYTPLNQVNVSARPDLVAKAAALGSLNISFVAKNGTHGTFSVCRFVALAESGSMCSDGVDNDCDGLSDIDDPDCDDEYAENLFTNLPSPPPNNGRSPRPPPPQPPPSPLAKPRPPRPPPPSSPPPPSPKKKNRPPPKRV